MDFLLNNKNNTIMQQTTKTNNMQTSKTPTPQNISKWSLGRKAIIANNELLKNQLDSKNTLIRELQSEIKELNIRVKLNGLEFPSDLENSAEVQFDYTLIDEDGVYLTYSVTNDSLGYQNEVVIPLSEIVEYFDNSSISQRELDNFIKDYIAEELSF